MEIRTNVELVTTFDLDKTPAHVRSGMVGLTADQLGEVLRKTFIGACEEIGLMEELNANGSYAIVSWGDN